MAVTTAERNLLDTCRRQPEVFYRKILGTDPHPAQLAIGNAVANHRRVSVVGCNGSGKDWMTGRLVHWWLSTRYPAKVIILAPTRRQVDDIVWRETRQAYSEAVIPLGGTMADRAPRLEYDDQHFAVGFAVRDALAIQGFHSPNLLAILSEAHGVPQEQYDSVLRLNPAGIIMTGNALGLPGGEFYESHHERQDLWETITIPGDVVAKDARPGMMSFDTMAERATEWGEDSPLYISSILAEWADNSDNNLVNVTQAKAAVERNLDPEGRATLGVDVARFGGDASVIYARRGSVARLAYRKVGVSTMDLAREVMDAIDDWEPDRVVIDAVGVGSGVYDRVKELLADTNVKLQLVEFHGGSMARNKRRFSNAIAECWWTMAQAFRRDNLDIEDDRRLVAQVTSRGYTEQSDRTIRLESKDDIKKRGGRSPDEADALAMTYLERPRYKLDPMVIG